MVSLQSTLLFFGKAVILFGVVQRAGRVMQIRPEINVSVGRVLSNFHSYTDRPPYRSSTTTKFPIHTSGVSFLTFKFLTLALGSLMNGIQNARNVPKCTSQYSLTQ